MNFPQYYIWSFVGNYPKILHYNQLISADNPILYSLKTLFEQGFQNPELSTYLPVTNYSIIHQNQVVSFAAITPNLMAIPEKYWLPRSKYLFNVCTRTEYQGKGYAKILLIHLLEQENQIDRIYLKIYVDNIVAKNLYLKLGFIIIEQTQEIIIMKLEY